MECPAPALGSGSLAEFSAKQLDQLQSVVRAAMQEEIRAMRFHDEALFQERWAASSRQSGGGPSVANALVTSGRGGGNPWGKVADEPVVAEEELLGSPTETIQPPPIESGESRYGELGHSTNASGILLWGLRRSVDAIFRKTKRPRTLDALDENAPYWQVAQCLIFEVVHGGYFDGVTGVIIIANCILIGVEVQLTLNGADREDLVAISWLDSIFLMWFVIEALLRIVADGTFAFQNPWFRFDFLIVSCGVLMSWVIVPIIEATSRTNELPYASQLQTLRVLRLLRTVRAFRTMTSFSELCKLCSGLVRSMRTMLSVVILVLHSVFIFTVIGVDLITNSDKLGAIDETRMIVESRFSSLPAFMLTLLQFTTADSLASIYYPLCKVEPLLVLYFLALWIVVYVSLMNLVTAVIVDSALSMGREEAEERLAANRRIIQKNVPNLEALFNDIDKDGSGSVTLREVQSMYKAGELVFPKDVSEMINPDHLVAMFEFIDKDKSGEVDKDEFVDGVSCLALSSMSIESMQMLQLLRSCHQMLLDYQDNLVIKQSSKQSKPTR